MDINIDIDIDVDIHVREKGKSAQCKCNSETVSHPFSCQAGADQTAHLIREPGENLLAMHEKVQRHRQLHAIALAYSEMQHSQRVRFEYDVVEPDSARFGKRTTEDGSARKHVGRTF